jgi:PIN domain nuclease of toxin-antitoxin system
VILVHTHVVVWLAFDQDQISRKARTAIDHARKNADGLAISDITLLELATLASKGRIRLDISIESFLQEVESRFVFCQSMAGHVPAPWGFQQVILRTTRIA